MQTFTTIDLRTQRGRAFKKMVASIQSQVGGECTYMESLQIENLAGLVLVISEQRVKIIDGQTNAKQADLFNRLLNTQTRLERALGLGGTRGSKEITHSMQGEVDVIDDLEAYLQSKFPGEEFDEYESPHNGPPRLRVNGRRRLSKDRPGGI